MSLTFMAVLLTFLSCLCVGFLIKTREMASDLKNARSDCETSHRRANLAEGYRIAVTHDRDAILKQRDTALAEIKALTETLAKDRAELAEAKPEISQTPKRRLAAIAELLPCDPEWFTITRDSVIPNQVHVDFIWPGTVRRSIYTFQTRVDRPSENPAREGRLHTPLGSRVAVLPYGSVIGHVRGIHKAFSGNDLPTYEYDVEFMNPIFEHVTTYRFKASELAPL